MRRPEKLARCEWCGRSCEVQTQVVTADSTGLICLGCLANLAGTSYTRPRLKREQAIGAAKRLDAVRKEVAA